MEYGQLFTPYYIFYELSLLPQPEQMLFTLMPFEIAALKQFFIVLSIL